jgi:hypothetical protein
MTTDYAFTREALAQALHDWVAEMVAGGVPEQLAAARHADVANFFISQTAQVLRAEGPAP